MIPLSMSGNNIDKYKGDERIAAQVGLDFANEFRSHGIEIIGGIGVFNRQVESVIKADPEGTNYSDCKALYEVRIAEIRLFGVKTVEVPGRLECIDSYIR
jgi:hypothetical protein